MKINLFSWDILGQADIFMVYCPELDRIYSVPVEKAPIIGMKLRIIPARQKVGVNWATDFEY